MFTTATPCGLLRSLSCFFLIPPSFGKLLCLFYLCAFCLTTYRSTRFLSSTHTLCIMEKLCHCAKPISAFHLLHILPFFLISPYSATGWQKPTQAETSTRFLLYLCSPSGHRLRLALPSPNPCAYLRYP